MSIISRSLGLEKRGSFTFLLIKMRPQNIAKRINKEQTSDNILFLKR